MLCHFFMVSVNPSWLAKSSYFECLKREYQFLLYICLFSGIVNMHNGITAFPRTMLLLERWANMDSVVLPSKVHMLGESVMYRGKIAVFTMLKLLYTLYRWWATSQMYKMCSWLVQWSMDLAIQDLTIALGYNVAGVNGDQVACCCLTTPPLVKGPRFTSKKLLFPSA